jgi:hypothetical protein
MLNPKYRVTSMGFILYDVSKGPVQKATRRLDMMSSNVRYLRCLNNPTRLVEIREVNAIAAGCAKVSAYGIQTRGEREGRSLPRSRRCGSKEAQVKAAEASKELKSCCRSY